MNDGAKKGDFLVQEKLILDQYMMNYGTNKVAFGTGEVDVES